MIANLAVLKSFGFILSMTKLFDRGRVAASHASFGRLFSVQVKFPVLGAVRAAVNFADVIGDGSFCGKGLLSALYSVNLIVRRRKLHLRVTLLVDKIDSF
jgi:hypothetical protein